MKQNKTKKCHVRKSAFTLVELLVAMAVFSVLMLALMQFFGSAQKLWTYTARKVNMYEDARVAMDLMARDIQSAYYVKDTTPFWHDPVSANFESLCFVAVTANRANSHCESRLSKAMYGVEIASLKNYLTYTLTGDKTSIGAANTTNWNFHLNSPPLLPDTTFAAFDVPNDVHKVIPYVVGLNFTCFNRNGVVLNPGTAGTDGIDDKYEFPYAVKIDLTLLNKQSFAKWKTIGGDLDTPANDSGNIKTFRENNQRKFSRMILIGERGQNTVN